ncbi:MAG: O-antigen ligase family protein [Patescibacteria group bacterium]
MTIAISIFCLLFLALALYRLPWALLVIIAALPSYLIRFTIADLPLTFLELMILIAFAVWFLKNFLPGLKDLLKSRRGKKSGRSTWQAYPFSLEMTLVLIAALIAVGISGWSAGAFGIWKAYFFEPLLLFILLFNVFKSRADWQKILWALLVSAAGVSLFALLQKLTGSFLPAPWATNEPLRVTSFFPYPNAVGLYLAPLAALFGGWLFYEQGENSRGKKIVILLTIITSGLAIYFARSEGALIGLLAAIVVFGLLATRISRIITLAFIILGAALIFINPTLKTFVLEKITLSDLSGEIRQQQWRETKAMLSGPRFLTGAGLDNYQPAIAPYHQEGIFFNRDKIDNFHSLAYGSAELREKYWQPVEVYLYPHNIFLNFWSELGLWGALLFVWIILRFLYTAFIVNLSCGREKKPEKYLALGLFAAMTAIVVHGLVDVPYFKNDLAIMFWILIALLGALNLRCRREMELK